MLSVSGHIDLTLRKNDGAYIDNNVDFLVGSCGHTVMTKEERRTVNLREKGRGDYQLIYIAKGSYIFKIDGIEQRVSEGNAVVYMPYELQQYGAESGVDTEMYWTHMTGYNCREILSEAGMDKSGVYYVGSNDKFSLLYKWTIKELQLKREGYLELATGYFKQILRLMARNYNSISENQSEAHLAESAMIYFYRHFSENISIDDYAKSKQITPCWFRRCFKKRTGVSPQQFINDIRLSHARELLLMTDFKISEVAERSGYENAFYFSRIFSKNTGCSPQQFRKDNKK